MRRPVRITQKAASGASLRAASGAVVSTAATMAAGVPDCTAASAARTATNARQASVMIAGRGSAVRGSVLPKKTIARHGQLRTLT
jgi:hypothetical protein